MKPIVPTILVIINLVCCSVKKENTESTTESLGSTADGQIIDSVTTEGKVLVLDTLSESLEDSSEEDLEPVYQFVEVSAEEYNNSTGIIATALDFDPNTPKQDFEVRQDEAGNQYEKFTQLVGTLPASGLRLKYIQGYENEGFALFDSESGRDYSIITAEFPDNPIESPDGLFVLQSYSDMGGTTGLKTIENKEGKWSTLFDWSPWSNTRIEIGLTEIKWHSQSMFYIKSGRNIYGELPAKYYKVYL